MEKLYALAFTHKNLPLVELGKLVPTEEAVDALLTAMRADNALKIDEAFVLATCNRVEYVFSTAEVVDEAYQQNFLEVAYAGMSPIQLNHFAPHATLYAGDMAATHLFRVMGSLDSLVVGEREIARQVRTAYEAAAAKGHTGDNLRLLMRQAIVVAKLVFTQTRIAEKPVSVASVAARALRGQHVPSSAKVLFIGAGETNTLMAKYLQKQGFGAFTVANRTLARAEALATELKGNALSLDELANRTVDFDVLVTCTSATEPLVTPELFAAIGGLKGPKVIVDLGIPNDVSTSVAKLANVHYIDIESLKREVAQNMKFRHSEVVLAEKLIETGLEELKAMQRQRSVEKALAELPGQVRAVRQRAETDIFQSRLAAMPTEARLLIDDMMSYMERGCISVPMKVAKQALLQRV